MKVLTATQLKELDAYTIAHEPISSLDLMERAARQIADAIIRRWPNDTPVKVFAGPGNNGGDALAVARMLAEAAYRVEVFLFNPSERLSEECQTNRTRLEGCQNLTFHEIRSQFEPPVLLAEDLIIDGLFGTGLNKPLNGGFASLVKYINASTARVVSIDIPSGLMCEDNTYNVRSHIIRADVTLSIQLPKLAFLLADNQPYAGEVEYVDIGLHPEGIAKAESDFFITERDTAKALLKRRPVFGHKGTFGHGLLVAGSSGMAGAAVLAARACLRSGIGKVSVHTPACNVPVIQTTIPEAVVRADSNEYFFAHPEDTHDYSAIAIGPGLGQERETEVAFIEQVRHAQAPLVIDADGLNILGDHKGWVQQIPRNSILTPHPKELERMVGNCIDSYVALSQARETAERHHLYIILKGHYTAVCTPEGRTYFNTTGNSGMGTAGSGDVLTGILLALLAQGYTPEDACRLGTYLHGAAGDLAAEALCEESLIASDIIRFLPKAFNELRK